MNERIHIGQLHLSGASAHAAKAPKASGTAPSAYNGPSFKEVLNRNIIKFSHHAEVRMKERGIQFRPESLLAIGKAIDQAAAKGAKDSLVVHRNVAMIVNVPSRTVITAMDGNAMQGNIFTQIDSAVIVP
ncbi:TIGR02530 family flagellar biosynthesis protein [Paenibacillus sp. GCM10027626]|uniref:TIGR02530 family flagellar biosynthesis protein n=1 Tax=Paenibacillus sp. GCM10027626 TaxID=3273411 RepID=UPI003633E360